MSRESKAHLRVIENTSRKSSATGNTSKDKPESPVALTSAFEAVSDALSAEDAFYRLQAWSQQEGTLRAQAYSVEQELHRGGLELLRRLLEENFRSRGVGDVGDAVVVNTAEGEEVRMGEHRDHERKYESIFGTIQIDRLGYATAGQSSIHPLDEELSLPQRRYSYVVQKRGAKLCGRGPYDEAIEDLTEMTAAHVPRRQLEEVVKDAPKDFDSFYEERCRTMPDAEKTGSILVSGVDCKGIPKRRTEEEKAEPQPVRLGKGEKRKKKKMATVASVHTTEPHVRTAEQVVEQLMDSDPPKRSEDKPRPEHRRLWASVLKSKDEVIEEVAQEMERRDPQRQKTAVCVMDGERALKIRALKYLKEKFTALILVLDIIHVIEYLWKASYAFHPEGSEAARLWVRERLLAILQGGVSGVVAGMRQSATKRQLSKKEREAVDAACDYYLNNKDRMKYHEYLLKGLPIASGAVEGACGHLVRDRMEITGALWKVEEDGADAVLKIRALDKSGDFDEYWDFHMKKEHNRLYDQEWKVAA